MRKPFIAYFEDGELYVMQRAYPSYVGKVVELPSTKQNQPIPGYHLFIRYDGTIQGNFMPTWANVQQEIFESLDNMATFISEWMDKNESGYSNFKMKVK